MRKLASAVLVALVATLLIINPVLGFGMVKFVVALIAGRIGALCVANSCHLSLALMLALAFAYNFYATWMVASKEPGRFLSWMLRRMTLIGDRLPRPLRPLLLLVALVPQVGFALSIVLVSSWKGSKLRRVFINAAVNTAGFMVWIWRLDGIMQHPGLLQRLGVYAAWVGVGGFMLLAAYRRRHQAIAAVRTSAQALVRGIASQKRGQPSVVRLDA